MSRFFLFFFFFFFSFFFLFSFFSFFSFFSLPLSLNPTSTSTITFLFLSHSGVAIFHEDPALDPRFRAANADFAGSGFDRGHMAPAANFKGDPAGMSDSFALSNICPQVGAGFNRDYYTRVERFIKTLARSDGPPVFVITGPLFLPRPTAPEQNGKGREGGWEVRHRVLGSPPRMVSVPTHFYKVVLTGGEGGDPGRPSPASPTLVGAFAFPNAPVDPALPLAAFAVPYSALEEVAGLRFFPALGGGAGGGVGGQGPLLSDGAALARLDGDALRIQAAGRAAGARARVGGNSSSGGGPAALLLAWPRRLLLRGGAGGGGGEPPPPTLPRGAEPPPDLPAGAPLPDAPRGRGRPPGGAPAAPVPTAGPPATPSPWRAWLPWGRTASHPNADLRHLCDAAACELPAADWWKSNQQPVPVSPAHPSPGAGRGGGGASSDSSQTQGRRRRQHRRSPLDSQKAPQGGWWWESDGEGESEG